MYKQEGSYLFKQKSTMGRQQQQPHFLVVTFPVQGHLNPGRHLAKSLVRAVAADGGSARITFSTTISAHRRMFPSISSPDEEVQDGEITYLPFSDGNDEGSGSRKLGLQQYMSQFKIHGPRNLTNIICDLAAGGRPVTCVIYTLLFQWVAEVARRLGITSVQYWIQPATVLAICYRLLIHGYQDLIAVHSKDQSFTVTIDGLPPLQIRDLPTFFTITDPEDKLFYFLMAYRGTLEAMESGEIGAGPKQKVLVNTFDELEPAALASMEEHLDLITIGPAMPLEIEENSTAATRDMFREDESGYMKWLNEQMEKSVVYVSFGSNLVLKKEQMDEVWRGLTESGRPYLWVVRKDSRVDWSDEGELRDEEKKGIIVEWCSQLRVLSHSAVGCFVTHGGWNSTLESLACGVPAVAVPQWADQTTNAWMLDREWGTGLRAEVRQDGVVEAEELRRLVEIVMGEGERGAEIRRKAEIWKERARKAIDEGGSSDRNLKAFVRGLAVND
ncbi:Cyanidin 3-O-rutinoside 5-O-glucosyltransferase [Apostasia shenzhenica]|uniref:Glycosyltransferase n=1 Tax=Apostasia shenzhenica TaxID=1088818 RepID=A0A2I0B6M1_9ASPA|nr:Cyanidin 3-O-rutinoside 5-O-glucosyltransferase [Apostasia shenzhenica]